MPVDGVQDNENGGVFVAHRIKVADFLARARAPSFAYMYTASSTM